MNVLTRIKTSCASLFNKAFSANTVQTKRGIPLGAVVNNLNQTREFSTTRKNKGAHKADAHHDKHDDGHHDEHHDHHDHHHARFIPDSSQPYDGIGPHLPKPPKLDIILSKIIGALSVFWVLFMLKERGAILANLEAPHWEHGIEDTDSEQDDADWEDDVDDDELEERLELMTSTSSNTPNFTCFIY